MHNSICAICYVILRIASIMKEMSVEGNVFGGTVRRGHACLGGNDQRDTSNGGGGGGNSLDRPIIIHLEIN